MPKPLSETRKENREEFENHCFVVDACRSCSGLGKHIDLQTTSNTRTCERCLGTGNEKEEYNRLKSFLSSAEFRILSAVKEKIEGMMKEEEHECHMVCCGSCGCQDKPEMNEIDRAKADLLYDLKSFIEEGMK